jgi:hypothetical protein
MYTQSLSLSLSLSSYSLARSLTHSLADTHLPLPAGIIDSGERKWEPRCEWELGRDSQTLQGGGGQVSDSHKGTQGQGEQLPSDFLPFGARMRVMG